MFVEGLPIKVSNASPWRKTGLKRRHTTWQETTTTVAVRKRNPSQV